MTSGVNSVATGVTGVVTGAAAALGASMVNGPGFLNPSGARRFGSSLRGEHAAHAERDGNGTAGDAGHTSAGDGAAGTASPTSPTTPGGGGLYRENQQNWTKLPQQIEMRSVQPSRAADSSYSAEKPPGHGGYYSAGGGDGGGGGGGGGVGGRAGGPPPAARASAVSMPRYEWDLGAEADRASQNGGRGGGR